MPPILIGPKSWHRAVGSRGSHLGPRPRRPRGRTHTITHSLLKTFRCRHCIVSTWSWQVTGVPARALSSGHNSSVSSAFRKNVEDSGSNRDSTTFQLFPSPSNCPKVCSGVIDRHHPPPVKPPFPLEIARNHEIEVRRCKSALLPQIQQFNSLFVSVAVCYTLVKKTIFA